MKFHGYEVMSSLLASLHVHYQAANVFIDFKHVFSERRQVLYSLSDSILSFCMFTHCSSNALVTYKEYSTSMIDAKMYSW